MYERLFRKVIEWSMDRPWWVIGLTALAVVLSMVQYPKITVDTDPENMLRKDEFVRMFHHQMKREFGIYDFIVLGVVNDRHPNGVFNAQTLNKVYDITEEIKKIDGVIKREIIAPSTKDNIRQGGLGEVVFEWLMDGHIKTDSEALRIRDEAMDNPLFYGTMVSEDGKALCIYIPIKAKNMSYRISQEIRQIISKYPGDERFYITGLPVAEDTFGVEMFRQMAISAPLAALIIFLLMFIFFKSMQLILSPMIMAVFTVLITMGLLIGLRFPVHIMSSMIPVFLMPIAVLDSVHILSEFFDKYRQYRNKKDTVLAVMDELFIPMLYTSLTSAVGFFSLSFSPIPPVQVFGVFVAIGVMLAWVLTITFIPAYISLMPDSRLVNFGSKNQEQESGFLHWLGNFTFYNRKAIVSASLVVVLISIIGIFKIEVNDNPVKWFTKKHEIRIADEVLNRHFSGTYAAYLVLDSGGKEIFKDPEVLRYIERLQSYLKDKGVVGKTSSLSDLVKKVYSELLGGDKTYYRIPNTRQAVSQCLISFENSHKPDDLWHFTTPDYEKLNIWVQLKRGDNKDMQRVVNAVDKFFSDNPPPVSLKRNWAGLTYINMIWQDKMVIGMLKNFLGSFFIVFFMMMFLFRSPIRALISMVPLTITILFIYGLLGWVGKEYDMPVAVLSALTLGLSIDFAIHFIQRLREGCRQSGDWQEALRGMFGTPARAIIRNALIIAIGFLPLLAAPLVPYKTVGFFMFSIMAASSIVTLLLLPAIVSLLPGVVFGEIEGGMICDPRSCFMIALSIGFLIAYILAGYTAVGWSKSVYVSVFIVAALMSICPIVGKLGVCTRKVEVMPYDRENSTRCSRD